MESSVGGGEEREGQVSVGGRRGVGPPGSRGPSGKDWPAQSEDRDGQPGEDEEGSPEPLSLNEGSTQQGLHLPAHRLWKAVPFWCQTH